ncbi:hypothetical protein PCE1_000868 [Barthelona sp. PCE]
MKMKLFLLAGLFVVLYAAYPSSTMVTDTMARTRFAKGEEICIQMAVTNGTDTYTSRFYPKIDSFSAMEMIKTGNTSMVYQNNVTLNISICSDAFEITDSMYIERRFNNGTKHVGFFSLVIKLTDGQVSKIFMDESCALCSSSCIENNCAIDTPLQSACTTGCNPLSYVMFIGTDRDEQYCTSAQNAFSKLQQFSLHELFDKASNVYFNLEGKVKESL